MIETAPRGTVILTGFKVFGNYKINPTEVAAISFKKKIIADFQIIPAIFTTYVLNSRGVPNTELEFLKSAIKSRYKAIISLGIASEVKGIRIERIGMNWVENEKYCLPHEQEQLIDKSRLAWEKRGIDLGLWDLDQIRDEMQKANISFEAEISDNAGSYCCNALIYRVLGWMEELGIKIPFLFLHVPCTKEAIEGYDGFGRNKVLIATEQLVKAIEIVVNSLRDK